MKVRKAGYHVEGHPEYGQASEIDAHQVSSLWQALIPQIQARVCLLWVRCHCSPPKLQLEQTLSQAVSQPRWMFINRLEQRVYRRVGHVRNHRPRRTKS